MSVALGKCIPDTWNHEEDKGGGDDHVADIAGLGQDQVSLCTLHSRDGHTL